MKLRTLLPVHWAVFFSILALAVRLIYLKQLMLTPVFHGLSMDSNLFGTLAKEIVQGDWGYKDSIYLNEFYPFFLALIYRIFGLNHMWVLLFQMVLDTGSCLLIYYLASRAFGSRVGLLSCLVYGFYGIAIFYTGLVLDTTVSIFLQLLFLSLLFFGLDRKKGALWYAAGGAVFGCLLLARPNLALFFPVIVGYVVFVLGKQLGKKQAAKWVFAFAVGVCLFIIPSMLRHAVYFHTFSPFAAHGGFNFYIGNNPNAEGTFMSPSGISSNPVSQIKNSIRMAAKETGRDLTAYEASAYWLRRGLSYLKENPLEGLRLYFKKTFLFFRSEEIFLNIDYPLSSGLVPLFKCPFFSYGMIAPLCLLGVFLSLGKTEPVRQLLILYYISCATSIILFYISDRYRLPSVPFAIMFSTFAAQEIAKRLWNREFGRSAMVLAPAATCAFFFNHNFEALGLRNTGGTHYNNLGILYIRQGETEKAVESLEKAMDLDPGLAAAYNNLGQLYVDRGDMKTGIPYLRKALDLDPGYAVAHYNMGMAMEKEGWTDEARKNYMAAIDLSPNLVEAQTNLGSLLLKTGALEEARKHFQAAIKEDPSFIPALEGIGNLQAMVRDFDAAVETFKQVIKIDPSQYNAHVNIALAFRKMGKLDEAVKWYEKAIQSEPERPEAYVQLGAALVEKGEADKAEALYQKALEVDPACYEACIRLGIVKAGKGNLQEAIDYFRRAVSIQPEGKEGHMNLFKAYLVSGDRDSALQEYKKILRLDPEAAKELERLLL